MNILQYLFHGTSTLYIPYIIKDGLTGRYPDTLFEDLMFFWEKVTNKEGNRIY